MATLKEKRAKSKFYGSKLIGSATDDSKLVGDRSKTKPSGINTGKMGPKKTMKKRTKK